MIQKRDCLKTFKQNYDKDTQNPQLSQHTSSIPPTTTVMLSLLRTGEDLYNLEN